MAYSFEPRIDPIDPLEMPDGGYVFDVAEFDKWIKAENESKSKLSPEDPETGISYPTDYEGPRLVRPQLDETGDETVETETLEPPEPFYINEYNLRILKPVEASVEEQQAIDDQASNQELIEPAAEEVPIIEQKVAFEGLKRALTKMRYFPALSASRLYGSIDSIAERAQIYISHRGGDEKWSEERRNKFLGKCILGGLTLGGLGIAILFSYEFTHVPIDISSSGHIHETAQQALSVNLPIPAPSVVQHSQSTIHAISPAQHLPTVPVTEHLQRTVEVSPGDGYTQVEAKLFPNHSAEAYLQANQTATKLFGPSFLEGVKHFRMSNGNWGLLSSGKAHINQNAYRFLSNFFKKQR